MAEYTKRDRRFKPIDYSSIAGIANAVASFSPLWDNIAYLVVNILKGYTFHSLCAEEFVTAALNQFIMYGCCVVLEPVTPDSDGILRPKIQPLDQVLLYTHFDISVGDSVYVARFHPNCVDCAWYESMLNYTADGVRYDPRLRVLACRQPRRVQNGPYIESKLLDISIWINRFLHLMALNEVALRRNVLRPFISLVGSLKSIVPHLTDKSAISDVLQIMDGLNQAEAGSSGQVLDPLYARLQKLQTVQQQQREESLKSIDQINFETDTLPGCLGAQRIHLNQAARSATEESVEIRNIPVFAEKIDPVPEAIPSTDLDAEFTRLLHMINCCFGRSGFDSGSGSNTAASKTQKNSSKFFFNGSPFDTTRLDIHPVQMWIRQLTTVIDMLCQKYSIPHDVNQADDELQRELTTQQILDGVEKGYIPAAVATSLVGIKFVDPPQPTTTTGGK